MKESGRVTNGGRVEPANGSRRQMTDDRWRFGISGRAGYMNVDVVERRKQVAFANTETMVR